MTFTQCLYHQKPHSGRRSRNDENYFFKRDFLKNRLRLFTMSIGDLFDGVCGVITRNADTGDDVRTNYLDP